MIDVTRYVGIPYVFGGSSFEGVDCWGLVWLFYREEFGIELPRYNGAVNLAEQLEVARIMHGVEVNSGESWKPVPKGEEQIGDVVDILLFGAFHVGLFVPNKRILHSKIKTASVIESMSRLKWRHSVRGCYRHV